MSLLISKPVAQVMEKPVEQPKVPVPETSRIEDIIAQYQIINFLI